MENATAPRNPRAKMTIEVYTVTREGIVKPPRATVSVPYGQEPDISQISTKLPPCTCYRCLVAVPR